MLILGIDTSNYATSAAVFCTDTKQVLCDKKRFLPVKSGERGLRQSDAVFYHTTALPDLLHELNQTVSLSNIARVGVSTRPRNVEGSYMPCFLVGEGMATAFSFAKGIPCVKTSHQQGHIAAALYAAANPKLMKQDILVVHASGGTTELLRCRGFHVLEKLGATQDLYAGQAIDRVGVRLGLSFPAGVQLSELAEKCTDKIRPKVSVLDMTCSLSGIENQCDALQKKQAAPEYIAKYCLSAVGYAILKMLQFARNHVSNAPILCAGGVMSSSIIQTILSTNMKEIYFVPGKFSSDNAIGTAVIAAGEDILC